MRPIKFRGFQNSWIYGGISIYNGEATIYDENRVANSAYDVDIQSVGEYAGVNDANSHEIYEGDIIQINKNTIFEIVFDSPSFRAKSKKGQYYDFSTCLDIVEVIGNTYENPELLA